MLDIVLYNSVGCEIDRVSVESRDEALETIDNWLTNIEPGDSIKFETN